MSPILMITTDTSWPWSWSTAWEFVVDIAEENEERTAVVHVVEENENKSMIMELRACDQNEE